MDCGGLNVSTVSGLLRRDIHLAEDVSPLWRGAAQVRLIHAHYMHKQFTAWPTSGARVAFPFETLCETTAGDAWRKVDGGQIE